MIAYLDTSVLLRVLLNQKNKLAAFTEIDRAISSKLLKIECLRTIDRLRLTEELSESEYLSSIEQLYSSFDTIEFIDVSDFILNRAGMSFPVSIGTLDAIHLISAQYWKERNDFDLYFLTHDQLLGKAAKVLGFKVQGLESGI
ncbi:MAG: hypothetical protein A3F16_05420 [Deltaproteobacteria bacterium RIFCSPHIGHO2_12_FULL_43_9]|nr:MAG: hypothetical protein A3F16_05420 [Deltaproteobacteria bacterium RIFCSPHIGHO2_12_FULL_43_9]